MKGMILAAGFGTRLGSLTQVTPKCLIEAGGKTLLEHSISKLKVAGVDELVVNLHHLAPAVEQFLDDNKFPGLVVHRSFEPKILDTGGGVKAAGRYLRDSSFFVHNADVYTTFELTNLKEQHTKAAASATLLVVEQPSSRGLLVDRDNRLCGWVGKASGAEFRRIIRNGVDLRLVNFCGIQLCNPEVLDWMEPLGSHFSIIEAYLRGVDLGATLNVMPLPDGERWFDVGSPEKLEGLRGFLKAKF